MSRITWLTGRILNFVPLYKLQKVHLFQGQFRLTRIKRLLASLGGRIGPCSNPQYGSSLFVGLPLSAMSMSIVHLNCLKHYSVSSLWLWPYFSNDEIIVSVAWLKISIPPLERARVWAPTRKEKKVNPASSFSPLKLNVLSTLPCSKTAEKMDTVFS